MNQIIEEYMIKNASTGNDLAAYVQDAIKDGWQPYGTPFGNGTHVVYQSMVKYEEPYVRETLFKGVPISKLSPEEKAEFMDEALGIRLGPNPAKGPFR